MMRWFRKNKIEVSDHNPIPVSGDKADPFNSIEVKPYIRKIGKKIISEGEYCVSRGLWKTFELKKDNIEIELHCLFQREQYLNMQEDVESPILFLEINCATIRYTKKDMNNNFELADECAFLRETCIRRNKILFPDYKQPWEIKIIQPKTFEQKIQPYINKIEKW